MDVLIGAIPNDIYIFRPQLTIKEQKMVADKLLLTQNCAEYGRIAWIWPMIFFCDFCALYLVLFLVILISNHHRVEAPMVSILRASLQAFQSAICIPLLYACSFQAFFGRTNNQFKAYVHKLNFRFVGIMEWKDLESLTFLFFVSAKSLFYVSDVNMHIYKKIQFSSLLDNALNRHSHGLWSIRLHWIDSLHRKIIEPGLILVYTCISGIYPWQVLTVLWALIRSFVSLSMSNIFYHVLEAKFKIKNRALPQAWFVGWMIFTAIAVGTKFIEMGFLLGGYDVGGPFIILDFLLIAAYFFACLEPLRYLRRQQKGIK